MGVGTLRAVGDRMVERQQRLEEARADPDRRVGVYRFRHRFTNVWAYMVAAVGLVGAWGLSASLDRFCALGFVIEAGLVVVGVAIATGLVWLCARWAVQPWHDVVGSSVILFGVAAVIGGVGESWRHSHG